MRNNIINRITSRKEGENCVKIILLWFSKISLTLMHTTLISFQSQIIFIYSNVTVRLTAFANESSFNGGLKENMKGRKEQK